MASIRKEIVVDSSPEEVWAAVRDVGAVHQRLVPGRAAATRIEGDERILTLDDGHEIRELILDIDDQTRRLAYAVVAGDRLGLSFHHATFEVLAEGSERSRLIWVTDLLPNQLAEAVRARIAVGAQVMKQTLEAASTRRASPDPRSV